MKTSKICLSLVFAIVMVLFYNSYSHSKTKLKLSSQYTEYHTGSVVTQWFADEVNKATNGEVEIAIFWSESLAKIGENLSLLRQGAIDMAEISPAYFPAELFEGAW